MDRNSWSRLVLGRDAGDAVSRSVGRQWLRWWGCGSAFVVAAIGIPILVYGTYNYDANLREQGEVRTVQVTEVDPANAGSSFTVVVDGREVELTNPKVVPKVGDSIEVVQNDDDRVILLDDAGAKDKAVGDAAFGVFIALVIFIGFGWGPGTPPFRAVRTVRNPDLIKQSAIVTIVAAEKLKHPPQGRVWGAWRRGTASFWDLDIAMPDKRVVRWLGRLPREPEPKMKVRLVGGGFPGDWVVLVSHVKDSDAERVNWPCAPLAETATRET